MPNFPCTHAHTQNPPLGYLTTEISEEAAPEKREFETKVSFGAELQSVYHCALIFRMAIVLLVEKYISFCTSKSLKKAKSCIHCTLGKF